MSSAQIYLMELIANMESPPIHSYEVVAMLKELGLLE